MDVTNKFQANPAFWRERRVLLTGHTGFKGAWLTFWLSRLGARVTGLSLAPATRPSLFELLQLQDRCDSHIGDIRDADTVRRVTRHAQPEVVLHLAAQALVRSSYREPIETFATNVMGTVHVLDAMRDIACARVAVMVTTDKVYQNREWIWAYREDDPLGGHDPYSASKAASEFAIDSWQKSFLKERGVAVASARAGNVIGGGDWSSDRLIPDAVRAWSSSATLDVRRPEAVRPWQHVLEPLSGYLAMAEKLWSHPETTGAFNFGPLPHEAAPVRRVIEIARRAFPGAHVAYGDSQEGPHEAGLLCLDPSRARVLLEVEQRFTLEDAVNRTMFWYTEHLSGGSAASLCERDIDQWMAAA